MECCKVFYLILHIRNVFIQVFVTQDSNSASFKQSGLTYPNSLSLIHTEQEIPRLVVQKVEATYVHLIFVNEISNNIPTCTFEVLYTNVEKKEISKEINNPVLKLGPFNPNENKTFQLRSGCWNDLPTLMIKTRPVEIKLQIKNIYPIALELTAYSSEYGLEYICPIYSMNTKFIFVVSKMINKFSIENLVMDKLYKFDFTTKCNDNQSSLEVRTSYFVYNITTINVTSVSFSFLVFSLNTGYPGCIVTITCNGEILGRFEHGKETLEKHITQTKLQSNTVYKINLTSNCGKELHHNIHTKYFFMKARLIYINSKAIFLQIHQIPAYVKCEYSLISVDIDLKIKEYALQFYISSLEDGKTYELTLKSSCQTKDELLSFDTPLLTPPELINISQSWDGNIIIATWRIEAQKFIDELNLRVLIFDINSQANIQHKEITFVDGQTKYNYSFSRIDIDSGYLQILVMYRKIEYYSARVEIPHRDGSQISIQSTEMPNDEIIPMTTPIGMPTIDLSELSTLSENQKHCIMVVIGRIDQSSIKTHVIKSIILKNDIRGHSLLKIMQFSALNCFGNHEHFKSSYQTMDIVSYILIFCKNVNFCEIKRQTTIIHRRLNLYFTATCFVLTFAKLIYLSYLLNSRNGYESDKTIYFSGSSMIELLFPVSMSPKEPPTCNNSTMKTFKPLMHDLLIKYKNEVSQSEFVKFTLTMEEKIKSEYFTLTKLPIQEIPHESLFYKENEESFLKFTTTSSTHSDRGRSGFNIKWIPISGLLFPNSYLFTRYCTVPTQEDILDFISKTDSKLFISFYDINHQNLCSSKIYQNIQSTSQFNVDEIQTLRNNYLEKTIYSISNRDSQASKLVVQFKLIDCDKTNLWNLLIRFSYLCMEIKMLTHENVKIYPMALYDPTENFDLTKIFVTIHYYGTIFRTNRYNFINVYKFVNRLRSSGIKIGQTLEEYHTIYHTLSYMLQVESIWNQNLEDFLKHAKKIDFNVMYNEMVELTKIRSKYSTKRNSYQIDSLKRRNCLSIVVSQEKIHLQNILVKNSSQPIKFIILKSGKRNRLVCREDPLLYLKDHIKFQLSDNTSYQWKFGTDFVTMRHTKMSSVFGSLINLTSTIEKNFEIIIVPIDFEIDEPKWISKRLLEIIPMWLDDIQIEFHYVIHSLIGTVESVLLCSHFLCQEICFSKTPVPLMLLLAKMLDINQMIFQSSDELIRFMNVASMVYHRMTTKIRHNEIMKS